MWGLMGSMLRRNHAIVFVFEAGDEAGLSALQSCISSVEQKSVRQEFNTMVSVAIMTKRDLGLDADFKQQASSFFASHPVDGSRVKSSVVLLWTFAPECVCVCVCVCFFSHEPASHPP